MCTCSNPKILVITSRKRFEGEADFLKQIEKIAAAKPFGIVLREKDLPVKEYSELARKVRDTNGCYVVPAFTGLGAPHWDQYARGAIVGLTRGVNKNHIIRATLDSLCYQINDVLTAMQADAGIPLTALKVDGGACANNYLMQTMADISARPVKRPCCVETTALGAAYLAGLAVGYWQSTDDVLKNWSVDREFVPALTEAERTRRIQGWNKAVRCSYGWAKED